MRLQLIPTAYAASRINPQKSAKYPILSIDGQDK
jgi:hypothetical protein